MVLPALVTTFITSPVLQSIYPARLPAGSELAASG
jgi:hypothetical protein